MRVAFVISTDAIEFDERVRKEAEELRRLGHRVSIVALENANRAASGTTSYGVPFRTTSLTTRRIFRHRRFLFLKAVELHLRLVGLLWVSRWDVLWVHNLKCAGMVVYGWMSKSVFRSQRLVWDQHELGSDRVIESRLYQWLLEKCDAVVHANPERAQYVGSKLKDGARQNSYVIENLPRAAFAAAAARVPANVSSWLGGDTCVLFQGVVHRERKIFECVDAVYRCPGVKLLVVGPCDGTVLAEIRSRWPDFESKVHITGWTSPDAFPDYLAAAQASLIFYGDRRANSWFCASNRFYHAILRGVPIICGPNPTMRNIVEKHHIGVVVNSCGDDPHEIAAAINEVRRNHAELRQASLAIRDRYLFESQVPTIQDVAGPVLDSSRHS